MHLPHGKTIVVFWLGRLSYRTSYLHIYYIISRTICQEVLKNNLNIISITKKRKPLSGKSWRGMPLGIYIIPLVCYLGLEPSSISKVSVGNTGHSFTRGLFPPFSACPFLGCDRRGSANSKGNRSSPLYAICLNWIHDLQFVDFDSKLFYGRHCQIEPDGEHPTSIERNRRHLSMRL